MVLSLMDLIDMTQAQADTLFRRCRSNKMPDGPAMGTALVAAGNAIEGPCLWLACWLAWRNKVFDRAHATVVDDAGPFGLHIRGSVYIAPSRFDQQPAIILDYSKTSGLTRKIRDEIRQVSPITYLGIVYYGDLKAMNFVLEFEDRSLPGSADAADRVQRGQQQ
jgi:hypothetical protein